MMTSSSPWSPLLPIGHLYRKCGVSNIQACSSYRVRGLVLGCQMRVKHRECDANKLRILRRRDLFGIVFSVSSFLVHSIDAHGAGLPSEEKPKLCDDNCEKELENVPMVTTESGLQYKDIKVGVGPSPPIGFQFQYSNLSLGWGKLNLNEAEEEGINIIEVLDGDRTLHGWFDGLVTSPQKSECHRQVAANYIAMVPSGQIFDSSLEKGQVYIFRVGSGQVVKGLDEGILSMKVGGKRRIYIPGPLAFPKGLTSAPGRPRVAANSPVIFDVTLEYIPGLEVDEE